MVRISHVLGRGLSLPKLHLRGVLLVGAMLLGAVLLVESSVAQQPTDIESEALRQAVQDVRGEDLQGKDGPLAKIGINLSLLYRDYRAHRQQEKAAGSYVAPRRIASVVRIDEADRVVIDAIAAPNEGAALLAELRQLGLTHGARAGRLVSGRIPIERLDDVAAVSSMHSARLAAATTGDGKTVSQGDAAMLSDDVRASQDLDGSGVTVGVLSDTYDQANVSTTAEEDIESGDLPPESKITILEEGPANGALDEGRAMMQIIHDVAPGASQAFHTAFNGRANFAQGIRDLANDAGADVVVDDIIYFAEPMFQDGQIAQAADDVNSQGVAYFSSAGNSARQSYESDYRESGTTFDFDPSSSTDTEQSVTIADGSSVTISFQWDNAYASAGPVGASVDLDIFILDKTGDVVASSETDNVGGDPVEWFRFENDGSIDADDDGTADTEFQIQIERVDGSASDVTTVKYVYFGTMTIQEYATQSATSYGHANAAGAIAVGAAYYQDTPEFGTSPPQAESFSSVGGVPIFFNKDGSRKTSAPVYRNKPEITAPDGVNTTFFGSDSDGDGFPNFFGTSAAAPHAAGLAALQIEDDPGIGPGGILSDQQGSAIDMGASGFDNKTGEGLIQAPETIGIPSGGTDLAVSVLEVSPEDPTADDEITHTATVCNEGGSAAGSSTVEFGVAGESNPPTFSVPALDPSRCHSVDRTRQLAEGEYQNRAVADVNNAVSETDESNNEATLTYEVGPPPVPDLVVASINHTPDDPTIEDEITFNVSVCNRGPGEAGSSQVEFQIGEEESPPTFSISSLDPDQCAVVQRTEQLTQPQTYQLVATADVGEQVEETDETNNVTEGSVTVELGELVVTHNQIGRFGFPEVTNFVTATTTLGDPIENLSASNFDVEENGTVQSVSSVKNVSTSSPPLSAVLVMDRSGSMGGTFLSEAKTATKSFVDGLQSGDKAALVSFGEEVSVDQAFTTDRDAMRSAIDGLSAGGRTAFYDAVAEAVTRANAQPARTAIIALVDGWDNESSATLQDVIDRAQQEDQPVFTIGLGDGFDEDAVRPLAQETGGRFFDVSSPSDLESIYRQLLQQLQNQYQITYSSGDDARDGTERTVTVTATKDDATGTDERTYRTPKTRFALPSLTIENNEVPVRLTSLRETVFEGVSNNPLVLSATSSDENIVTVARKNGLLVLTPKAQGGPIRIGIAASDGSSRAEAALDLTVEAKTGDAQPPTTTAVAPVAEDGTVGFADTGVGVDVAGASGGPAFLTVDFFAEEPSSDAGGSASKKAGLDDFENVSPYRWEMASGALSFGEQTQLRIWIDSLPGENRGGVTEPSTVEVLLDSTGNGAFEALSTNVDDNGTPDDISDDQLLASGASKLGTVRLASDSASNPLPVELADFRASLDGGAAVLRWKTASETDNAGFEVQHKGPEASEYVTEGFVEGAGTTTEPQQYRFRVDELKSGTHEFRLRQVDVNGTAALSRPVTLDVEVPRVLSLEVKGSHPTATTTRLAFTVRKKGRARLFLYDVLGRRVRVLHDRAAAPERVHTVKLSANRLPSGTYFARLVTAQGTKVQRVVVVH